MLLLAREGAGGEGDGGWTFPFSGAGGGGVYEMVGRDFHTLSLFVSQKIVSHFPAVPS